MQRSFVLAAAAAATLMTATVANAGGVNWSIGINVPPIAAVVGAPAYYPAPAYYASPAYPAAAYYPPPVAYAPRPRFWLPPAPPLPRVFWGGHRDVWHRDGGYRDGGHNDGGHYDGGHDNHVGWHR
jgi:hypothetical protein